MTAECSRIPDEALHVRRALVVRRGRLRAEIAPGHEVPEPAGVGPGVKRPAPPDTSPSARTVRSMPALMPRRTTRAEASVFPPAEARPAAEDVHHPADRVAAVERRARAAHHLDTVDRVRGNRGEVLVGPYRKVELLRRMPSTISRTWFPVRPRTNGDPPPWFVFCTKTPVIPVSVSGVERSARRDSSSLSRDDTDSGTSIARRSSPCAVTVTASSTRTSRGSSTMWTGSPPADARPRRPGTRAAWRAAGALPAGRRTGRMSPRGCCAPGSEPRRARGEPRPGAARRPSRTVP